MTKVEVFSTIPEADSYLKPYFSDNYEVTIRILKELQARSEVYRKSAEFRRRHPNRKEAVLTPEEFLLLSQGLGRGEAVTGFFKLYSSNTLQLGFDYTVFEPDKYITVALHSSIADLADSVRKRIMQERKQGIVNLKIIPLFYTINEPFTYSKENKRKAQEEVNYSSLPIEDRIILDRFLDTYLERGLNPAEIKDFISSYATFLN